MEISNPQHQIMASHRLGEIMDQNHQNNNNNNNNNIQEKKAAVNKPHPHPPEQSLRCPRCDSTNTKFCYYNNYSLSQPRYFCKGCRRYWTQGGSLRNVPVGGGCRKNHHSKRPSTKNKPNPNPNPNLINPLLSINLPPLLSYYDPSVPTFPLGSNLINPNPIGSSGFLDILRSGFLDNNTASIDPAGINIMNNNLCSYGGGDDGGERKVALDCQWQFGNNDQESVVTVDDTTRGYSNWNVNGDGSSCYYGLNNRNLM